MEIKEEKKKEDEKELEGEEEGGRREEGERDRKGGEEEVGGREGMEWDDGKGVERRKEEVEDGGWEGRRGRWRKWFISLS